MLKILVNQSNSRLEYTLEVLFSHFSFTQYTVFNDEELFRNAKGAGLIYGVSSGSGYLVIPSAGLLQEGSDLHPGKADRWQDLPTLFAVPGEFDIPFDLFSASFYLISRMEEYGEPPADEHGRYLASDSVASKFDFLSIPIVEFWLKALLECISDKNPGFRYESGSFHSSLLLISIRPGPSEIILYKEIFIPFRQIY